jgi:hypothetical protein
MAGGFKIYLEFDRVVRVCDAHDLAEQLGRDEATPALVISLDGLKIGT